MHSLWLAQRVGPICGISCQTYQFGRIFARFSRVETNFSGKNTEKVQLLALLFMFLFFAVSWH